MKKNLFFLAVIALLAVSCGNKKTAETTKKQFPKLYYAGEKVTTSDTAAVFNKKTVQWTVCGTDKTVKGTIYRPAGDTVFSHTITAQGNPVPDDSLNAWAGNTTVYADRPTVNNGGRNSGTSNGGSGSGPDLSWLWWVLAALVTLGAIWLASWLIKNWPEKNSSPKNKTGMTNNSAANPAILAGLNETINRLKGVDGKGKGSIKYNHPTEGFEVTAGKGKSSAGVYIENSGNNVNFYFSGTKMKLENSGNTGMPAAEPKKDEPKKEEPAAPGTQA